MDGARQERLNVHVATVLSRLGLFAQAEVTKRERKAPDLIIQHPLLGLVLGEAEVGDAWNDESAKIKLNGRVSDRFSDPQFNFIDNILLLVYPRELVLRSTMVSEAEVERLFNDHPVGMGLAWRLRDPLDSSKCTSHREWYSRPVYVSEIPTLLEEILRQKALMPTDPLQAVREIEAIIGQAAQYCATRSSEQEWLEMWRGVANELEIDFEAIEKKDKAQAVHLTSKTLFMLIAVSILVYEVARSRFPTKLSPLGSNPTFKLLRNYLELLKTINYVEVVDLVLPALEKIPEDAGLVQHLGSLHALVGKHLVVLLRGGLASLAALYQGLLSETYRDAYATFFTKMPAAQLLSELAVRSWDDKVIDPACGTGSLLVATFLTRQRLAMAPSVFESVVRGESEPVLDAVSRRILGNTYGMDALRVAVALTSASLTVFSRGLPRDVLKVVHTPVGSERAGSLDLLTSNKVLMPKELVREEGKFTLVIMNPPFTRSDRISQLIGDKARRDLVAATLKFGRKELQDVFAAGLSKPFLALADRLVEQGGRIAAVLPNSFLSRPTWQEVRRAIADGYTFRYLVVSWAEGAPNFSSDTEFREVMVVLEKRTGDEPLTVIHLLRSVDSLSVAAVAACARRAIEGDGEVNDAKGPIARIIHIPQDAIRTNHNNLYRLVALLDDELLKLHLLLLKRYVCLNKFFEVLSVVDHTSGLKEIKGPLDPNNIPHGKYAAIWGAGWEYVRKPVLDQIPSIISVESEKEVKVKFWKRSENYQSDLFVLRRGQLDTQGVIAVHSKFGAISNVWWPLMRCYITEADKITLSFLAFMNSTFGFLHMLAERLETRGLWLEYKKEHYQLLPLPDFVSWEAVPNEVSSALEKEMPRFDRFLSEMSSLERQLGGWSEAAKHASNNPGLGHLSPRAMLDLYVGHMLTEMYGVHIPATFYTRLYQEVDRLRKIMESRNEGSKVAKDIGVTKVKRSKRKEVPLEWFDENSPKVG